MRKSKYISIRILEGKSREHKKEAIFEERITKNFPKTMEDNIH